MDDLRASYQKIPSASNALAIGIIHDRIALLRKMPTAVTRIGYTQGYTYRYRIFLSDTSTRKATLPFLQFSMSPCLLSIRTATLSSLHPTTWSAQP